MPTFVSIRFYISFLYLLVDLKFTGIGTRDQLTTSESRETDLFTFHCTARRYGLGLLWKT